MIAEKCHECQIKLDGECSGIQAEAADSEEKPCEDYTPEDTEHKKCES